MLSQHGQNNIAQIIFLIVCEPWSNTEQVKTLCNIVQESPDNIGQEKVLINVVLILLGQQSTGKNLAQCC